jgi:hypothetical protein
VAGGHVNCTNGRTHGRWSPLWLRHVDARGTHHSGLARLATGAFPWGIVTSHSLPACPAHSAAGYERRFRNLYVRSTSNSEKIAKVKVALLHSSRPPAFKRRSAARGRKQRHSRRGRIPIRREASGLAGKAFRRVGRAVYQSGVAEERPPGAILIPFCLLEQRVGQSCWHGR